ncbi:hypothetical protein COV15_01060 [Candidatus Woesearchaeota archaeon CG10_big_fil_rev_8_21_14_0_10_34_12]|nr:MAG: hypothetical protein COV15_01060 [Candidatus Woesearchaeota archaeon CG10_big_fil_rev_8_21_14_0_10_34_12]
MIRKRESVGYIQQLADYIKKNLSKGYTIDSLKTALMAQGYSRMQIDRAIHIANEQLAMDAPKMVEKPVIKIEIEPEVEIKKTFWEKIKNWFGGKKEEETVDMPEMFSNKHISEHKKIARFSVPENQKFSWHSQKPKTNKEVFDMSKYKELI